MSPPPLVGGIGNNSGGMNGNSGGMMMSMNNGNGMMNELYNVTINLCMRYEIIIL